MTLLAISSNELLTVALCVLVLIFSVTYFNIANVQSISKSIYQVLIEIHKAEYVPAQAHCVPLIGKEEELGAVLEDSNNNKYFFITNEFNNIYHVKA